MKCETSLLAETRILFLNCLSTFVTFNTCIEDVEKQNPSNLNVMLNKWK